MAFLRHSTLRPSSLFSGDGPLLPCPSSRLFLLAAHSYSQQNRSSCFQNLQQNPFLLCLKELSEMSKSKKVCKQKAWAENLDLSKATRLCDGPIYNWPYGNWFPVAHTGHLCDSSLCFPLCSSARFIYTFPQLWRQVKLIAYYMRLGKITKRIKKVRI